MHYDPHKIAEFYGAIAKRAIRDHQDGYHHPAIMPAGAFLETAGAVLGPDGSVRLGRYVVAAGETATKRRRGLS